MIIGLHHPGIVVSDIDKARKFYEEVLGFKFLYDMSWDHPNPRIDQIVGVKNTAARAYVMKCNNCYLELFQYSSPEASIEEQKLGANEPGIRHLCFEVEDANVAYARLKKEGSQFLMNEPITFPSGGSAVYCRDPFGNIIEFSTAGRGFPSITDL